MFLCFLHWLFGTAGFLPEPARAGGVHSGVHELTRYQPLQQQQEEEVQDGYEGEDGAGHRAAVGPQPPQPPVEGEDVLCCHPVVHLREKTLFKPQTRKDDTLQFRFCNLTEKHHVCNLITLGKQELIFIPFHSFCGKRQSKPVR